MSLGRRARLLRVALVLGNLSPITVLAAQAPKLPPVQCSLDVMNGRLVPGGFLELISWAADPASGAPVANMDVWLDGSVRGDVLLSGYRPDVARYYARSDYLWSGWTATVSLRDVAPGMHSVDVLAGSRSGEWVSCGSRVFEVRSFRGPVAEPWERIGAVLLARVIAFLLWLTFVGWGAVRLWGSGPTLLQSALLGLALLAVALEAGAALRVRPLAAALALTALSAILLAISLRVRRARLRRPKTGTVLTLGAATLFAVVAGYPLTQHGEGAVLGQITDAAWECSVADSIARFGWRVPSDVQGHLATVPSVWRQAHFRAGAPYPLAFLAQAFGVRAHEVHSVLVLAGGILVICASGALAMRILPGSTWGQLLAVAMAASSSILIAGLYTQHAGILLATVLFLAFLFFLFLLVRSPRAVSIGPVALTLAAAWTVYPETTPLWILASVLGLSLAGSWNRARRAALRILLAALLACALNPFALARSIRFGLETRQSPALATVASRTVFGDVHYFPSLRVIAGLEPYRLDAPAPGGMLMWHLRVVGVPLMLWMLGAGFLAATRRERRILLLLLAPVALWLLANRLLEFPYGYSKGLLHVAPLWSLCFALLAVRAATSRHPPIRFNWMKAASILAVALIATLSAWSARHVVRRAVRAVPGYDPAFRILPDLARSVGRSARIVVSEPFVPRREWVSYFLGEYRVFYSPEEVLATDHADHAYRLIDRSSELTQIPVARAVASSDLFALVPF
ncbi:MAG TPA: hypothetical protein VGK86_15905 [Thermoanaerobaculia bacterium]